MKDYLDQFTGAFSHMIESMNDPQVVHAVMVHLPVAIGLLGALGAIVLMLSGAKWSGLRWSLVLMFALGAVAAWFTSETGEDAEAMLSLRGPWPMSELATQELDQHKSLGEWVWVPMLATALLLCLTAVKSTGLRVLVMLLALVAALGNAAYVAVVAHHGGNMVYIHGVGVPATENNFTKPLPTLPTPGPAPDKTPDKPAPPTTPGAGDTIPKPADDKPEDEVPDVGPQLPGSGIFD